MRCPGQDTLYWKPGAIFDAKCPKCGKSVEFFKDDTARRCEHCGHRFVNPQMDFGCAAYCQFAEQCIGTLPPELLAQKEDLLKDRVAIEMKRRFKSDFKRIGHAGRTARYAERIAKQVQGNLPVVLCSAYLYRIGEVTPGQPPEQAGPATAREVLTQLKAADNLVEAVCGIVGHHGRPADNADLDLKIVYDADRIAEWENRQKSDGVDSRQMEAAIQNDLILAQSRDEARKVLLTRAGSAGGPV